MAPFWDPFPDLRISTFCRNSIKVAKENDLLPIPNTWETGFCQQLLITLKIRIRFPFPLVGKPHSPAGCGTVSGAPPRAGTRPRGGAPASWNIADGTRNMTVEKCMAHGGLNTEHDIGTWRTEH